MCTRSLFWEYEFISAINAGQSPADHVGFKRHCAELLNQDVGFLFSVKISVLPILPAKK